MFPPTFFQSLFFNYQIQVKAYILIINDNLYAPYANHDRMLLTSHAKKKKNTHLV